MPETLVKSDSFLLKSSPKKLPNTIDALPFCKCSKKMIDRRLATNLLLKNTCQCGENIGGYEWKWHTRRDSAEPGEDGDRSDVIFEDNIVTFHPIYSQGTAVVRGDTPLEHGRHHYWEIKIMSFLTGTDLVSDLVIIDQTAVKTNCILFFVIDDWHWY